MKLVNCNLVLFYDLSGFGSFYLCSNWFNLVRMGYLPELAVILSRFPAWQDRAKIWFIQFLRPKMDKSSIFGLWIVLWYLFIIFSASWSHRVVESFPLIGKVESYVIEIFTLGGIVFFCWHSAYRAIFVMGVVVFIMSIKIYGDLRDCMGMEIVCGKSVLETRMSTRLLKIGKNSVWSPLKWLHGVRFIWSKSLLETSMSMCLLKIGKNFIWSPLATK